MLSFFKLNLQLFAEGGGDGGSAGGEGATTGETGAVDAGQQRLLELGVPADKIRKRAKKAEPVVQSAPQVTEQQAAADVTPTEEQQTEPKRMTWDEIMADPEYNRQMQSVVQTRLKSARTAEDSLSKLAPALEVLARRHGMDMDNLDYEALAKAIDDDNQYYEERAMEMGVSTDTAKRIDQQERQAARQQREEARNLEQQRIAQHLQKMEQEGNELKKTFPNFDLRKELMNPAFARMTAPNVGISVQDAYYAIHRQEIQTAAMQVTAQKTAERISNSIQAGMNRPVENGSKGQAASVMTFDYSKATKAERDAIKKRIRDAAARGEKVYPGR